MPFIVWTWLSIAVWLRNVEVSAGLDGSWYCSCATSSCRNACGSSRSFFFGVVVEPVLEPAPEVLVVAAGETRPVIEEVIANSVAWSGGSWSWRHIHRSRPLARPRGWRRGGSGTGWAGGPRRGRRDGCAPNAWSAARPWSPKPGEAAEPPKPPE